MDARKFSRKKKHELRFHKFEVLLNEEERLKIIEMAKSENLPVSTFIRWKLMRKS